MKLILSPAKGNELWCIRGTRLKWARLSPKVVSQGEKCLRRSLQECLGSKRSCLTKNKAFIEGWKLRAKLRFAIELHKRTGVAGWSKMGWNKGLGYGSKHVRILSALYGAVAPDAYVKPYRLDMLRPLRVDGKSFLKAYWNRVGRVVRKKAGELCQWCSSAPY